MTSLGFTGTRNISGSEQRLADYLRREEMVEFLGSHDAFVTGACIGWDAMIGLHLVSEYPEHHHVVVVPWDRSRVDYWWEHFDQVEVVYMDDGTDYRDRNKEIVRRSDQVFYCADYPESHGKSRRSGTWMTKRLAEAAGLPASGIILNNESDS